MDQEILVKKIGNFIEDIESKDIRLSLVMLANIDPDASIPKYALILSSPDFDRKDPKTVFDIISKILLEKYPDLKSKFIAYLSIIRSTDPFVKSINSSITVEKFGRADIKNSRFYQAYMQDAIIFLSKKRA